tara:strand:- start:637 stop:2052 length:1416 start_codon:yes stop_codon:yes gene_type:complete
MRQISETSMSIFWDELEKIAKKKEVELNPVSGFEANTASLVGSAAVGLGTQLSIKQTKPLLITQKELYGTLEVDRNTGEVKRVREVHLTPEMRKKRGPDAEAAGKIRDRLAKQKTRVVFREGASPHFNPILNKVVVDPKSRLAVLAHEAGHATGRRIPFGAYGASKLWTVIGLPITTAYGLTLRGGGKFKSKEEAEKRIKQSNMIIAGGALGTAPMLIEEGRASKRGLGYIKKYHPRGGKAVRAAILPLALAGSTYGAALIAPTIAMNKLRKRKKKLDSEHKDVESRPLKKAAAANETTKRYAQAAGAGVAGGAAGYLGARYLTPQIMKLITGQAQPAPKTVKIVAALLGAGAAAGLNASINRRTHYDTAAKLRGMGRSRPDVQPEKRELAGRRKGHSPKVLPGLLLRDADGQRPVPLRTGERGRGGGESHGRTGDGADHWRRRSGQYRYRGKASRDHDFERPLRVRRHFA